MSVNMKPKHIVLQEFEAVLLRMNPMNLKQDNPLEYETEALSILSRFTESALQLSDDEGTVASIAFGIVRQSLDFWFENTGDVDCERLANELLRTFKESFGTRDDDDVPSAQGVTKLTIGC